MPKCSSLLLATAVSALLVAAAAPSSAAIRFYGHGTDDLDRIKIRLDDPALPADPGPPADIGATDFTIEFWVRGALADNGAPATSCSGYDWIYGNILLDRDRYSQGRSFGLSFGAGRPTFGLNDAAQAADTLCGTSMILDGDWHHVSIGRRRSDGFVWLHVDGVLEADVDGPDGDVSYPDDGVPNPLCGPTGSEPCTGSDPFLVLGAEKHDAGPSFPAFAGDLAELRLSTTLRYGAQPTFSVPTAPFVADAQTAALYRLEGPAGACTGAVPDSSGAPGGPSEGVCRFGGTAPSGPVYLRDSPFAATVPGLTTPMALIAVASSAWLGWRRVGDR